MGTWSPSILGNDLALDIRAEYRDLLEDGVDEPVATETLVARYDSSAQDADEATAFWTGLALSQAKLGRLQQSVKDKALALINDGGDLHLWADPRDAAKRRQALERLRDQLLGPQRQPVRLRRHTPVTSPVDAGDVFTLPLIDGRTAILHTIAISKSRLGQFPVVEMIDVSGRPFRNRDPLPRLDGNQYWRYARFHVVAKRQKDVPPKDTLQVVGHRQPPTNTEAGTYCNWAGLKATALRLLDDPSAQPEGAGKLFKRLPRLF